MAAAFNPCPWQILILLIVFVNISSSAWQDDLQPKRQSQLRFDEIGRFHGNRSHLDYFRILQLDGDSLLVGARNLLYNLSLVDLNQNTQQTLEWHPSGTSREMCLVKGKSESDCQNYIRVLGRINDEEILICGTNAYNPLCRRYTHREGKLTLRKESSGKGLCPYDPNHNSTAVVAGGELYAGTVSDFSALDPLIYREPLRTEQYDLKHLNAPSFVSSLSHGDHVYFFFRETAVEYINCGKAVFSRVGRVCKNDKGGPHRWTNRWTSFLKSRLNCSIPGNFPFYFNEIQSTSDIIEGTYGHRSEEIIYGIFTTPENSILGSAVCAFRVSDIVDSFDGTFKEQATLNANWLPVPVGEVPEPRPGSCLNDSRTLPESTLNFVKSHSLMDETVPSLYGMPLITHTSLKYKFTNIAVDPQVRAVDGKTYDIIIIGTDKGKIIRVVNIESYDSANRVKPVIIEEIQASSMESAVKSLKVVYRTKNQEIDPQLIIVFDDEIQSVPLRRCHSDSIKSCSECVALQDPHCAWSPAASRCVPVAKVSGASQLIQNVLAGFSEQCPEQSDLENTISYDGPKVGASQSVAAIYSAETFAIAVAVSCFSALVVGFLTGLLFSRKYKLSDGTFRGAPHLEQRRLSRLNDTVPPTEPAKMNNFIDNQLEKNANNTSTLELKKVKKTYV